MKRLLQSFNFYLSIFIVLIILLIVLQNVLFQLDSTPKDSVTKIYYADNISPAHQELIRRFNQEFSGRIEVVPVDLPFTKFSTNERKELLARTLRSKSDRIDLLTVDVIWVPRFAKWAQPLDKYFPPEWRTTVLPHVVQSCYYNNNLVAIPLYTDVGLLYYRKDLIRELPNAEEIERKLKESLTWDEFIALGKEFCRRLPDHPYYIFPANNYEGLICSFYEGIARNQGARFYQSPVIMTDPYIERHVQRLQDLVHRYRLTPPIVTKFDEFQGYLYGIANDAAIIRGWPGFLKHYRKTVPDSTKLDLLEVAALPHNSNEKPAYVYGGWNFMLSRFSEKKEAALQFIRFCLRKENQILLFEKGGYIPVVKSVYEDSVYLARHPELHYYQKLLKYGVHRPYLENYTKISDVLSYYLHLAIQGELAPHEALQRATEAINAQQVLIK